jgi:hypothetical protein
MRDIKDYLHLYLGCEAMHGDRKIVVCGLNINSYYIQNILNEDTLRISDIKPILRPLSSLTNEERTERGKAIIQYGKEFIDAEYHRWMLSKGFDIFNLIPEGLAIDKTTLK